MAYGVHALRSRGFDGPRRVVKQHSVSGWMPSSPTLSKRRNFPRRRTSECRLFWEAFGSKAHAQSMPSLVSACALLFSRRMLGMVKHDSGMPTPCRHNSRASGNSREEKAISPCGGMQFERLLRRWPSPTRSIKRAGGVLRVVRLPHGLSPPSFPSRSSSPPRRAFDAVTLLNPNGRYLPVLWFLCVKAPFQPSTPT
ncbi:hypothetical protein L227DRAFT_134902 [Lentinus tigrinus ALCF2SS1-6]|uniref:Uncharacterized protein n=1 Tax=Lentinus tigrinus ALCF2SS1-6 TaxID=1328759 RepID=A0A5C2SSQ6_9APHY|nr:hypothetical protein L227DRAFT_134902 [Lentinus tigrinus ALCF2SS1-6]